MKFAPTLLVTTFLSLCLAGAVSGSAQIRMDTSEIFKRQGGYALYASVKESDDPDTYANELAELCLHSPEGAYRFETKRLAGDWRFDISAISISGSGGPVGDLDEKGGAWQSFTSIDFQLNKLDEQSDNGYQIFSMRVTMHRVNDVLDKTAKASIWEYEHDEGEILEQEIDSFDIGYRFTAGDKCTLSP